MLNRTLFEKYANSPADFRADLLIDVNGTARKFGDVADRWQLEDFQRLDPGVMVCNGRSTDSAKMRSWLERPRGHSKTCDLGIVAVWALAFAQRPLRGFCYASDRDQAKLLLDAVSTLCRLNPWLSSILTVESHRVVNRAAGHPGEGGVLTVEASDAASSYGILPDLVICDEVTHWQDAGENLWTSVLSSAAKRSNCMLVIISNAGFADSWQWHVREAARSDDGWIFSRLGGPQASWMTPKRLEEQRRMLPAVAFNRLWLNEWSTGGGDALTPADIEAVFIPDLQPMTGQERDWLFCAGLDLGLTRDGSSVVVLGIGRHGSAQQGRIRLAHAKLWRPIPGRKINLTEVENYIARLDHQFDLQAVAFDPWQAEHLAQRLEMFSQHRRRNQPRRFGQQSWMREVPPTAANLRDQATLCIEAFADRRLQLYDYEPLRRDLMKLRVEEKSYGCRLTSPRDGDGHGDTFSAFALALFVGHDLAGKRKLRGGFVSNREERPRIELSEDTSVIANAIWHASGGQRGQSFY